MLKANRSFGFHSTLFGQTSSWSPGIHRGKCNYYNMTTYTYLVQCIITIKQFSNFNRTTKFLSCNTLEKNYATLCGLVFYCAPSAPNHDFFKWRAWHEVCKYFSMGFLKYHVSSSYSCYHRKSLFFKRLLLCNITNKYDAGSVESNM